MSKDKKHTIKLDQIQKENVFNIPENYFNDLPGIIQLKTSAVSKKENKLITLSRQLFAVSSLRYVIPTIALIFVITLLIVENNKKSETTFTLNQISEEEILSYLAVYDDNEVAIYSAAYDSNVDIDLNDFIELDESDNYSIETFRTDNYIDEIELDENIDELIELL